MTTQQTSAQKEQAARELYAAAVDAEEEEREKEKSSSGRMELQVCLTLLTLVSYSTYSSVLLYLL